MAALRGSGETLEAELAESFRYWSVCVDDLKGMLSASDRARDDLKTDVKTRLMVVRGQLETLEEAIGRYEAHCAEVNTTVVDKLAALLAERERMGRLFQAGDKEYQNGMRLARNGEVRAQCQEHGEKMRQLDVEQWPFQAGSNKFHKQGEDLPRRGLKQMEFDGAAAQPRESDVVSQQVAAARVMPPPRVVPPELVAETLQESLGVDIWPEENASPSCDGVTDTPHEGEKGDSSRNADVGYEELLRYNSKEAATPLCAENDRTSGGHAPNGSRTPASGGKRRRQLSISRGKQRQDRSCSATGTVRAGLDCRSEIVEAGVSRVARTWCNGGTDGKIEMVGEGNYSDEDPERTQMPSRAHECIGQVQTFEGGACDTFGRPVATGQETWIGEQSRCDDLSCAEGSDGEGVVKETQVDAEDAMSPRPFGQTEVSSNSQLSQDSVGRPCCPSPVLVAASAAGVAALRRATTGAARLENPQWSSVSSSKKTVASCKSGASGKAVRAIVRGATICSGMGVERQLDGRQDAGRFLLQHRQACDGMARKSDQPVRKRHRQDVGSVDTNADRDQYQANCGRREHVGTVFKDSRYGDKMRDTSMKQEGRGIALQNDPESVHGENGDGELEHGPEDYSSLGSANEELSQFQRAALDDSFPPVVRSDSPPALGLRRSKTAPSATHEMRPNAEMRRRDTAPEPARYNEVTRGKELRKGMKALNCEQCEAFYRRAAMNSNAFTGAILCEVLPLQPKSRISLREFRALVEQAAAIAANSSDHPPRTWQHVGRHRVHVTPPKTPPNFWKVGWVSQSDA